MGVNTGSVIRVQKNTYSVDSRLIGEEVDVRIHADHLQVWYAQKEVERMPRLRGTNKRSINYRHVIDWLVRKPGAFENYRYRDELFPTSRFRMAYDALREWRPATASRDYLKILHLAARENESAVDDALRVLLDRDQVVTSELVHEFIESEQQAPAVTDVAVGGVDLSCFDSLFTDKEVWYGCWQGCEIDADGAFKGTSAADVS